MKIICTTYSNFDVSNIFEEIKKLINNIKFKDISDIDKSVFESKEIFTIFFDVDEIVLLSSLFNNDNNIDVYDFENILRSIKKEKEMSLKFNLQINVKSSLKDIVSKINKYTNI